MWLDDFIQKLIQARQVKKYIVADYITPSGRIHVGSLRGVVLHGLIGQGLKEKGKKAEFIYGYDDVDPMDGFPVYLPEKFKQYMGWPLFKIPAPDGQSKNFAVQFAQEFEKVFNQTGFKPKTFYMSDEYRKGKFNQAIKIVLQNAEKIRQIYKEVSGSVKENWLPLQVICPQCGKIGTTRVYEYDEKKDVVKFKCEPAMVLWAKGCGYTGEASPYDGQAKISWKTEWSAKWRIYNETMEGAGKDHMTKGGSWDVAAQVARRVFKIQPPFPLAYEWFLVGGKKMASSKGLGVSAAEIAEILPQAVLSFLVARTHPKRTINFDPEGETIPQLFDDFDRAKEAKDKKLAFTPKFSKIAYLLQMPTVDIWEEAAKEKGSALSATDKAEIKQRIFYAQRWLKTFAPDYFKFEVQKNLPAAAKKLSPTQKTYLKEIAQLLKQKSWSGDKLHEQLHQLKSELKLSPRDAFAAIYLVILGKDSGPQAGWLLASLDRGFVVERFRETSAKRKA